MTHDRFKAKRVPRLPQALLAYAALFACMPAPAAESPVRQPAETYESAGSWLKVDSYNYINPVKGQVLRFYEGLEDGYEDTWAAYLIDLKARTVKKLCELSKPFVESSGREPSFTDFRVHAAALTPAGDKLILECMEGPYHLGQLRKGADHNSYTRMVFSLSLPAGKQEEILKRALNSSMHGNHYSWWGGASLCLDSRALALWIPSWDAALNFNASRIDLQKGTKSEHLLEKPKPNYAYGTSLAVLADGSLAYAFDNEIKIVRWSTQKVEKLPPPPGSWVGNIAGTAEGDGLLAVSLVQAAKGESSTVLWMVDSTKGKTWRKVGELPSQHYQYYGYQYYQRGLCADQEVAWVVLQKVNPNSWGWTHGWGHGGYGGYGGYGNQSKFQILSMDLKTGAVKVVWRNHDVEALFYAGLAQTQQAPKPTEPAVAKVPAKVDTDDLSIGPTPGGNKGK